MVNDFGHENDMKIPFAGCLLPVGAFQSRNTRPIPCFGISSKWDWLGGTDDLTFSLRLRVNDIISDALVRTFFVIMRNILLSTIS